MKKFNVWGSFTVEVDFDIDAKNEKEAEKKAKEMIKDTFYLDSVGGIHVPKMVDFKLYTDENEDN